MKKSFCLIIAVSSLLSTGWAQTAKNDLIGLGMKPEIASYLAVQGLGESTLANNTYLKVRNAANSANISVLKVDATDDTVLASDSGDVIKLNPQADPQRFLTITGTSDTATSISWGDAGTTATQDFHVGPLNANGDNDSSLMLCGGGLSSGTCSSSFGGMIELDGEDDANKGDVTIDAGDSSTSDIRFRVNSASGAFYFTNASNQTIWSLTNAGVLANTANAGDLSLSGTGSTVAIQEATAGSACSGTLTANGATPVVTSTTCARTGSRIFLSRTSAETGTVNAWVSALTDATSFAITSEAADTGTYNWIIFHEAA